jgi:prevent-host-death family protein
MARGRVYSASDARKHFAEVINDAAYARERIVITKQGTEIAAVVPVDDLQLLEALESFIDLEDARNALAEARRGETKSLDAFAREISEL